MKPVIFAMTLATALAAYWILEEFDCLMNPSTGTCVECTDDCLDHLEAKR